MIVCYHIKITYYIRKERVMSKAYHISNYCEYNDKSDAVNQKVVSQCSTDSYAYEHMICNF